MTEATANRSIDTTTADQVAASVLGAIQSQTPLVDYGLAHRGLGHAPPTAHTKLRQHGGVIEHYRDDFTVTVNAGCTLGDLHRELVKAKQFLPVDAEDDLTIGEVITHNVHGALRVSYGGPRDLLLGLSYVDGLGRHITVGGRTVKNVAGYDVTRLMVGSLGELGVVTSATLRTYALPAGTVGVDLKLEDPQVMDEFLPQWLLTDARPAWLMMTKEDKKYVARIAYFGTSVACMTQLRSLETLLQRRRGISLAGTGADTFERDRLRRDTRGAWRRIVPAMAKVVVPPDHTGFICRALAEHPAGDPDRQVEAFPMHGVVYVGGPLNPDAARRLDEQIAHITQPMAGFRVWYQRPTGAPDIEPVSPMPSDYAMLCRLKATMDPHNVLNPGRFLVPNTEPGATAGGEAG